MGKPVIISDKASLFNPLLAQGDGKVSSFSLLTYAIKTARSCYNSYKSKLIVSSRLPPWHLPILLLYTIGVITIYELKLFPSDYLCKGGAAVGGTLSMVIGLLLSYRFSSAIAKFDKGRQVWTDVRSEIRDAIRMLSVLPPSASAASRLNTSHSSPGGDGTVQLPSSPTSSSSSRGSDLGIESAASGETDKQRQIAMVHEKTQELAGTFVGFAFALQPLPQPPLCDLLPPGYLASLKRTDYRVRFAESHAGPSSSNLRSDPFLNELEPDTDSSRPGIKRRSTGRPTSDEINEKRGATMENLRDQAEKLAGAVASATTTAHTTRADLELRLQLDQLNFPNPTPTSVPASGPATPAKSNLVQPNPPNLPLALLRIMEMYVVGLAEAEDGAGGWSEAKRERGLGVVKALGRKLGEAEVLNSAPPPLPLTLHLSHLLVVYLAALPTTIVPVLGRWSILVTLIAGWCFFGLEALTAEVGGVFGTNENHLPLARFTSAILSESLEISLPFRRAYHARLSARFGEQSEAALDVARRRSEEWTVEW